MNELQGKLEKNKIILPQECFERFHIYGSELLKWNKIHNLSGVSTIESVEENIFDSLYPLKFIDDFASCMDIGSGGGFPALPLAIAKPETQFYLIEPRLKRAAFLQNIIIALGLEHIEVLSVRIENVPIAEINNLDLVTSRAVMGTKEMIALSRKFLNSDGYFLFYKGTSFRKEMPSMSIEECFERENRIYYYKHNRDL